MDPLELVNRAFMGVRFGRQLLDGKVKTLRVSPELRPFPKNRCAFKERLPFRFRRYVVGYAFLPAPDTVLFSVVVLIGNI